MRIGLVGSIADAAEVEGPIGGLSSPRLYGESTNSPNFVLAYRNRLSNKCISIAVDSTDGSTIMKNFFIDHLNPSVHEYVAQFDPEPSLVVEIVAVFPDGHLEPRVLPVEGVARVPVVPDGLGGQADAAEEGREQLVVEYVFEHPEHVCPMVEHVPAALEEVDVGESADQLVAPAPDGEASPSRSNASTQSKRCLSRKTSSPSRKKRRSPVEQAAPVFREQLGLLDSDLSTTL